MTSPPAGLKKQVASSVAWAAAQHWLGNAITFVVFIVLARLLRPDAFGLMALAVVYIGFVELVVSHGFPAALIQRRELEEPHSDSAFWASLIFSLALTGLSWFSAPPISHLFSEPQLIPVIRWLSIGLPLGALSGVQVALLRRELKFRSLTIRRLSAKVVGGAVGVGMALSGLGVWSLVGQQLVTRAIEMFVVWGLSSWRPTFRFSFSHFSDLFGFGIHVTGRQLLEFASNNADNFLIGLYLGPVALGFYQVAFRFTQIMMSLFGQTIGDVALPAFSRVQSQPERLERSFYTANGIVALVTFPVFFGILVTAPELVSTVFGMRWLPSVPVMQILAFVGVWRALTFLSIPLITAMGKPAWALILTLARTLVNILAFAISVRWGIAAVALGLAISNYALTPLVIGMVRRLLSIDFTRYLGSVTRPLAASIAMAVMVAAVRLVLLSSAPPLNRLVIEVAMGFLVYAGVIWLIGRDLLVETFSLVWSIRSPARPKLDVSI